jgi:hypothetical protein
MIYVRRPVLCSQGDAEHLVVTLNYPPKPHQLPKLFSAIGIVDVEDDERNYEKKKEKLKLLYFKWSRCRLASTVTELGAGRIEEPWFDLR